MKQAGEFVFYLVRTLATSLCSCKLGVVFKGVSNSSWCLGYACYFFAAIDEPSKSTYVHSKTTMPLVSWAYSPNEQLSLSSVFGGGVRVLRLTNS